MICKSPNPAYLKTKHTHNVVFDRHWFAKHQGVLLWLANSWLGPLLFRFKKMGHYLIPGRPVALITPHSVHQYLGIRRTKTTKTGKQKRGVLLPTFQAQFFTKNEYARKLYVYLYPIWLAMHAWDWIVADHWKLAPQLSFGFSTLTQYPDNSTTGSAQCDRHGTTSEGFATLRASAGTAVYNNQTTYYLYVYHDASETAMVRCPAVFDTSSLGTAATITDAVLSAYGSAKAQGLGTPNFHACQFGGTTNITFAASDYNIAQWGASSLGNIAYTSFNTAGYNDITLNDNTVVSKTGMTRLGWRLHWDMLNDSTGLALSGENSSEFDFTGSGSASNKPKLVVTYTAETTYYHSLSAVASNTSVLDYASVLVKALSATASNSVILTTLFSFAKSLAASASNSVVLTRILTFLKTLSATFTSGSGGSASSGPNSPGTMADDDTVGTEAWSNPDNAKVSDDVYAGFDGGFEASSMKDSAVRIVKSDGTIATTNKGLTATEWPTTESYISYGSPSDLWDETWEAEDINDVDFGVVLSAVNDTPKTSHYLKATNFGFSIPVGATINGILVEIEKKSAYSFGHMMAYVDHIRITVYYTLPGGAVLTAALLKIASLASTASNTVSLDRIATYLRTLAASAVSAVTLLLGNIFYKTLSVSSAPAVTLSFIKTFYRSLSVVATGVVSLAKGMYQTLSVTASGVVSLSAIKGFYITLASIASIAVSLSRLLTFYRTLSVSSTVAATLSLFRQFYRTLSAAAGTTVSLIKGFLITLSAIATGVPSLARLLTAYLLLTATASLTASLSAVRFFYRTLAASASNTATIVTQFLIGKTLTTTFSASVTLIAGIFHVAVLLATAVMSATLSLQKTFYRTLAAVASVLARLIGTWDKYTHRATSFLDKYSLRGTSSADKYSARGTTSSDKYSARGTSSSDKYTPRGTVYKDKY